MCIRDRNSTDTPVEEDSDYFIMLTAVNSDGKSEPVTVETNTSVGGIVYIINS